MAQQLLTPAEWAKQFDSRKLSQARSGTLSVDPTKETTGLANLLVGSPETLKQMGLSDTDFSYTVGGTSESGESSESYYSLSDKAKGLLSDSQVSHHAYDGRNVMVVRGKDGKVKHVSTPGDKYRNGMDDFADFVVNTGLTMGTGGAAGAIAGAAGLGTVARSVVSGAARGATGAGISGGDLLQGALTGGLTSGLQQLPGIKELPAFARSGIGSAAGTALRGGNLQQVLTSGVMGAAGSGVGSGLNAVGVSNPLINGILRNAIMQRFRRATGPGKG
jgi:hypothetical protein